MENVSSRASERSEDEFAIGRYGEEEELNEEEAGEEESLRV